MDSVLIAKRFEEAGSTLIALPDTLWEEKLNPKILDPIKSILKTQSPKKVSIDDLEIPTDDMVLRMNETYDWLSFIPEERVVFRTCIAARSLVHPKTKKYLYSWNMLSDRMGTDPTNVKRWRMQGLTLICTELNKHVINIA